MKNFEELIEQSKEKSLQLLIEFKEYFELRKTTNPDEDENLVFKVWAVQKLALSEVLQVNTNDQQKEIIRIFDIIMTRLDDQEKMINELKNKLLEG